VLPFCLPCFDVPGVNGKLYSSQFIVPADSDIESLQQCRGKVVAINNSNSNSGMNLLRYALAKIGARPGYFSQVVISGGHFASLEAVAANRAQLAAIDCVSYQLIADQNPQLVSKLRIIDYSAQTCGLPFVVPASRYTEQRCEVYLSALKEALARLPADSAKLLHLDRFDSVTLEDYQSIVELENFAIDAGYAQLN
ncbi:MAG: PhnD/SsuA/transferrin family substrate-binding protein, partial [Gammaproteobacteria bacterium]|nr:PhnD/SsuA/transferrin family substrate-binding protein [Gammaproteobacteria bacterium]